MAAKKVAMLREEMGRCMRELNKLRVEELEAELLGGSFGGRKGYSLTADNHRENGNPERRDELFERSEGNPEQQDSGFTDEEIASRRNQAGRGGGGADVIHRQSGRSGLRDDVNSFKTIWDTVAQSLWMCNAELIGNVHNQIEEGVSTSVFRTSGLDSRVLENLDQTIKHVLLKVRNLPGSAWNNSGLVRWITRECDDLSILCSDVLERKKLFIERFNEFGMANMNDLEGDAFMSLREFSECNEVLTNRMMASVDFCDENELCQMSLEIARKTMLMATHLVQVISMLKLYEESV
jgi:hypothetical protein